MGTRDEWERSSVRRIASISDVRFAARGVRARDGAARGPSALRIAAASRSRQGAKARGAVERGVRPSDHLHHGTTRVRTGQTLFDTTESQTSGSRRYCRWQLGWRTSSRNVALHDPMIFVFAQWVVPTVSPYNQTGEDFDIALWVDLFGGDSLMQAGVKAHSARRRIRHG